MSWVSLLPLGLGFLALRRRLWAAGWFLVARAGTDLLRSLLAPLREGLARPYQGAAKLLWLLTDVAPFLAPPAVLIALLGRRSDGLIFWLLSFTGVAVSYPEIRGDALLLRYYPSVYLTGYLCTWLTMCWRMVQRDRFVRDELALMLVTLTGALSVVSVLRNGHEVWWSTWITNGVGYAVVLAFALAPPRA